MKKKEMKTKIMAVAMSATMAASICPAVPAIAVTKDQVAKDGTYTKTAHVTRTEDDDEDEWNEYDVRVDLTVKDGKFSDIVVTPENGYESGNDSYFNKAYSKSKGIKSKLAGQSATEDTINSWDTVSTATRSSDAIKKAALEAIRSAPEASTAATVDTAALEASISKAKALKESDYTAETWNTLKTALASAETAVAEKKSQDTVDAAKKNLDSAIDNLKAAVKEEYKYVYAGLSWAEYWAAEGVQAAGDSSSSGKLDTKGESDKGAFDVVTRATVNHGLHRGSYQCAATIEAENGKSYEVSYWIDSKTAVLTDGKTITFDRGAITEEDGTTTKMTKYDVTGLKYVPVKVATEDYEAFCKAYKVVENGGELAGGFAENKLQSYKGLKAKVTADTNGLKTATKNADGTFSFSAKETGTESGIEGQELKTAPTAEEAGLTVKEAKGSYGEFLRVDLTGNYGDLGANMQSVKWTYYGDDSTYTNAKATYGTKFAADNWMHKAQGIQLGLTKSLRCTLPEGTDGTGYWTMTISALGYKDVTYNFQATDANIVKDVDEAISTTNLEAAIKKAEGLTESDYTAESWAAMQTELQEAKEELAAKHSQAAVDEATSHLNAAIESLVKAEDAVKVADADISAGKTTIELNLRDDFDPEYTVEGLNVKVEGNVLTFEADSSINPGKYTLTVKDKNGKYADLKTTFILLTTDMPATYDADNKKLTVAESSNEEAFNTYIGNITSVNVNGTDYAASGRGSVKIIDKDGTLVTDAAPFKDAVVGTEFQITVTSTGYTTPLTFTYKVPGETPAPSEVDTTKLAAAIEKAEGLNKSDYTKDSWKALRSELTKAKSALEAKESQDTVDKAADRLNKAIDALEAATPDEPTKQVSTDALEKAIKAAGALNESDYTADSWKALQSALAEADTALKEKKDQDTVDKATEQLNKAISALVKKDAGKKANGTNGATGTTGTNGTSGKSGKTGSTSNTKSGKAAKTGDPSGMFAWLGLAVTSLGAGIGGFSLKRKKREDEE